METQRSFSDIMRQDVDSNNEQQMSHCRRKNTCMLDIPLQWSKMKSILSNCGFVILKAEVYLKKTCVLTLKVLSTTHFLHQFFVNWKKKKTNSRDRFITTLLECYFVKVLWQQSRLTLQHCYDFWQHRSVDWQQREAFLCSNGKFNSKHLETHGQHATQCSTRAVVLSVAVILV